MTFQKLKSTILWFEDSKYPLLGPNIKGLYWFGLWQCGYKYRDAIFNFIHFCSLLFVMSEFIELYFMRNDLMKVLFNISITALGLVSISKTMFFIFHLPHWKKLIRNISQEEISALKQTNSTIIEMMKNYKTYSRSVTYSYWVVLFLTSVVTITSPFLKYATTKTYREMIRNGTEPYPQILSSWFPFDKTEMPGYLGAVFVHVTVTIQGAGVVAVYDSNAFAIISFLKGQFQILRYKCMNIFGNEKLISKRNVLKNIKECHRLHTFLIEQLRKFNSLISTVMFMYVMVCSIMICCSVVQLSMGEITASQKLWVIQYTAAMSVQLFLYCWHGNEVAYESSRVDLGLYSSNWWWADVQVRRQVLLLSGKLAPTFLLKAGPFTTFSMTTFIDIMKGSYSFYTLFAQHAHT